MSKSIYAWLRQGLLWVAVTSLFAVMVVGAVDVVGRLLFSSPLRGASELIETLMALLVFTALPILSDERSHISISLVDSALKGRAQAVQRIGIALLSAACLVLFAWTAMDYGLQIAPLGDRSDILAIPKAPILYFIALGCALAALMVIVQVFKKQPHQCDAEAEAKK